MEIKTKICDICKEKVAKGSCTICKKDVCRAFIAESCSLNFTSIKGVVNLVCRGCYNLIGENNAKITEDICELEEVKNANDKILELLRNYIFAKQLEEKDEKGN